MDSWADRSVLEAASWRLAGELVRRHPKSTRLIRGHPGGGLSDCLWILPASNGNGDIRLNRNGTIQVISRFDGARVRDWSPTSWETYLRADPRRFLAQLEGAAGLSAPAQVPAATQATLTYRVLASIAATAVKSVRPIEIESGYIDSSGGDGGRNDEAFLPFPTIPEHLLRKRADDFFGEPGYRFGFIFESGTPILALEQSQALAWTIHGTSLSLMENYRDSNRNITATTSRVLLHTY